MKKLLIALCVLTGASSLMAMEAGVKEEVITHTLPSGETELRTVRQIEEGVLEIRDAEGNLLTTVKAGSVSASVRFTKDGKMIIAEIEGVTRFYDAKTGEEINLAAEAKTPVKEVGIQ